jgi:hypothetical protein
VKTTVGSRRVAPASFGFRSGQALPAVPRAGVPSKPDFGLLGWEGVLALGAAGGDGPPDSRRDGGATLTTFPIDTAKERVHAVGTLLAE